MRVLITGITGFVGGHLTEALLAAGGAELFGTSRRGQWPAEWQHLAGRARLHACDLADRAAAVELLGAVRPERIIHLAGYANAGQSLKEAEAAWTGNLTVTRSLYEAVHQAGTRPRILYVGSGLSYGDPEPPGRPLDEDCPLRPVNPYAASKAAADLASYQVTRFPGLDVVRARPFNHTGPRQSAQYAVPNFARQLAAIERGAQEPVLRTGDLSALRDLTDVRDTVRAYLLLLDRGRTGEAYNVATGESHAMQSVLDRLVALTRVHVEVRPDPTLRRAAESVAVRCDAGKLRRETGWAPRYSLDQTLADILDYWRSVA